MKRMDQLEDARRDPRLHVLRNPRRASTIGTIDTWDSIILSGRL